MSTVTSTRLDRSFPHAPEAAPIRIVHLGLGNFHRAHQAWYTEHASDAAQWGIAAFTGRRPDAADELAPQDGLYTLIIRAAESDRLEVVGALAAVHAADDHEAFLDYLRRPEVAVLTITLTEAAYRTGGPLAERLVAGLDARRQEGAGPITVLPCDNLPHNGAVARELVLKQAGDPELQAWIADQVDFATSMVDRITPATTDADRELVADRQGYRDVAPVPTEPYTEWVVSGAFRAGRPDWESAGARFVADVTPYEQRKLWLLNGSHSLLAYAGSLRGHTTIAEAVADPQCRAWIESFWDEACPHLDLPGEELAAYRAALTERYTNPRIRHLLGQIAADGSLKLPVRIIPSVRAERAAGREPVGGAAALAAWIWHLRGRGCPVKDPNADAAQAAAAGEDAVREVLELLEPGLGADQELVTLVERQLAALDH